MHSSRAASQDLPPATSAVHPSEARCSAATLRRSAPVVSEQGGSFNLQVDIFLSSDYLAATRLVAAGEVKVKSAPWGRQ